MEAAIFILSALFFAYLIVEAICVRAARRKIKHIVHVNGTRGKSSVSRLIEAGLRAGGKKVCCKTTGTDPVFIGTDGKPEPVKRIGKPNIREQARTLIRAQKQGAEILVIECMAVQPELQLCCERDILRADIGVITNARRDHIDVMGKTLHEIAESLSATVPRGGILFTAEKRCLSILQSAAQKNGTACVTVDTEEIPDAPDFPENVSLALRVCAHLGVDRQTALNGMRTLFQPDPYALSLHRWKNSVFINGFSANDPESIVLIYRSIADREEVRGKPLTLLINNRPDRGTRTEDTVQVCKELNPDAVFLLGASKAYMRSRLKRCLPGAKVYSLNNADGLTKELLAQERVIYAVGNIAGPAREVMERVRREGTELVR